MSKNEASVNPKPSPMPLGVRRNYYCNACGKYGRGDYAPGGWYSSPDGWFTRETDADGSVIVCSRACAAKLMRDQ